MTKIHNQDQLIDAAAKVFAEKGYDAARLEDIAAEVGVLQGSLYYHVGSKAALLRLVRQKRFRRIMSDLEAIAAGPDSAREKLRQAIANHLRHIQTYFPESSEWNRRPVDQKRTAEQEAEDSAMTTEYRRSWKKILRQGIDEGELQSDIDLSVTVMSLLGMMSWVSFWYQNDGSLTMEQIAEFQFNLIWSGIAVP